MSGQEVIEMDETTPLQDGGNNRENGLNEADQHQPSKQEDEALMACMTFAQANDKTQFVRLFVEEEFILTYGFLEKLYSKVDNPLLIKLLLECLKERLGASWEPDKSDPLKEISLWEVSGVLKKFMGEEKPFYLDVLLEDAKQLLEGECSYRNDPCKSPWSHLFIWAVLQNHSDMAVFFWEKAEEPVLDALSACKMLKEMSALETQTGTKLSIEKLAQKFKDTAHGMLGSYYQSNESHSFDLLNRKSPVWDTNCVQMGIAVESHGFFKHKGLESMLTQAWWGDIKKDTAVWKVLLTFYCLPLLFTNLISYRPSYRTRCHQFWGAPIITFVGNAQWYILFLFLFGYVLLVESGPSIVLYFWVFTFLCQEMYEAFFMRDITSGQRMKLYMHDIWNVLDITAIELFVIGQGCRMFEWSYQFGRCVLCIDYMIFTLRLIHFFAVLKQMGPKIIILGMMVKNVFSFLLLLWVWILAFGVANQGLKYDYDPNLERIVLRVFYLPYLHVLGQDTDEWDLANHNCSSNMTEIEAGAGPCRSEYWLSNYLLICLLVVFLLVTIILVNTILTSPSDKEEKIDQLWKMQHYNLIMEYKSRPALPPPFIIINHLNLFFSFLKKKFHRVRKPSRDSRPTDSVDGLVSWERKRVERKRVEQEERAKELKVWETAQKQMFLIAQSDTEKSSDSEMMNQIMQMSDKVSRMLDQQTVDKDDQQTQTIDQKIQQMADRMEKQLTEQLTETKASLETKVENALGQILDLLKKKTH